MAHSDISHALQRLPRIRKGMRKLLTLQYE